MYSYVTDSTQRSAVGLLAFKSNEYRLLELSLQSIVRYARFQRDLLTSLTPETTNPREHLSPSARGSVCPAVGFSD